jgi:recombinational DNA repair ATPase RecF
METKTTFFTADNVQLKNFKGIADFKDRLNGECCLVIGSEAAGKSNLLMGIYMILKQYPSAILKQGEEDGKVSVEISRGETKYLFKFSFEEDDDTPKMKTLVDGEKLTMAKQSEVIKMLTPVTFDLDTLINAKGQAQVDIVLKAFDIDVGVEKEAYKEAFDERKLAKASLEENSHFETKEEVKEIDTKALRAEIVKIDKQNETWQSADMKLGSYEERLQELKDELTVLNGKIAAVNKSIKEGKAFIKANPPIDTAKQEEELSNAEVTNEQARDYKGYLAKVEKKKEKQTIVSKNETTLKEASKAIVDKINSAKLPVPKLNITTTISESSGRINSVLTYGGLPFDADSINTAERIAIGAKLQMSLFKPGNLAIITVNAGSIGDATIKSISEECEKRNMQCLFELTSRDDKKQLQIETVLKK